SGRSNGAHTAGQRYGFWARLGLHARCQHSPAIVIGMQRSGPVTGREVQAHQAPVGVLMQWGEDEPAVDRFNGSLKLSCFELHLGEAVEDLTRAQVPVLALEPHPVVEGRGIAERETLQELAMREAGRTLEPGKQVAMRLFRHG